MPKIRSRETIFTYKDHCFLCGTEVETENKTDYIFQVRTWDCQISHTTAREQRGNDDEWARTVRARIEFVHDLPAADALYHRVCSIKIARKNFPLDIKQKNNGMLKSHE